MTGGLLAGIARHGLPGATPVPAWQALGHAQWCGVRSDLRSHRLVGLAVSAVIDGELPVTESQYDDLRSDHVAAMGNALLLDRALLEVDERLRRAGIPVRVLKGSALAHTLYPDPWQRSFSDLDVLVPTADFDRAVVVLTEAGGRPRYDEPHPGFTRRFGKGVCIVTDAGYEIDVHRTFVSGPFGLKVHLDELFDGGTPFNLGGRQLLGLGEVERFMHACFHTALGNVPPRWSAMRDVAQMLVCTGIDLDEVRRRSEQWESDAVLARALTETWRRLELSADHSLVDWARRYQPSTWETRALEAYVGPDRGYAAQALVGLSQVPGVIDKLEYLRWILFPDRRYLASRDGSYSRRLMRSARLVARSRSARVASSPRTDPVDAASETPGERT